MLKVLRALVSAILQPHWCFTKYQSEKFGGKQYHKLQPSDTKYFNQYSLYYSAKLLLALYFEEVDDEK